MNDTSPTKGQPAYDLSSWIRWGVYHVQWPYWLHLTGSHLLGFVGRTLGPLLVVLVAFFGVGCFLCGHDFRDAKSLGFAVLGTFLVVRLVLLNGLFLLAVHHLRGQPASGWGLLKSLRYLIELLCSLVMMAVVHSILFILFVPVVLLILGSVVFLLYSTGMVPFDRDTPVHDTLALVVALFSFLLPLLSMAYFHIRFYLAERLIVERRMDVMEAFAVSWQITKGKTFGLAPLVGSEVLLLLGVLSGGVLLPVILPSLALLEAVVYLHATGQWLSGKERP